jgi:tungstate transport system substrate-binding protein
MTLRRIVSGLIAGLLTLLAAVTTFSAGPTERILRLATTTSTDNSGLLRYLLPSFEKETGFKVHVIAVGTGKALRMGQDGDVDVVVVHAPAAEAQFVAAGYGVNRRDLMYNDFVFVGPRRDPAGIRRQGDAVAALRQIAKAQVAFVSRGDDSGTHKKELELWQETGIKPAGAWYRSAGQGMEQILQMANEMGAYTLADRGTWLALRPKLNELEILVQGDARLFNPYGVIAVNPERYPDANYRGAMAFIAWLTSVEGQRLIASFNVNGDPLFFPVAVRAQSGAK